MRIAVRRSGRPHGSMGARGTGLCFHMILLLFLLGILSTPSQAFLPRRRTFISWKAERESSSTGSASSSNSSATRLGWYNDQPLSPPPPPPPPRNGWRAGHENYPPGDRGGEGESDDEEDNEDEETVPDDPEAAAAESKAILFEFDKLGREKRGLLPPLGRRLDTGIPCYYEPTDPLVESLVEKTDVHVQDACWALEACRGDLTEAWTRISTARRLLLEEPTSRPGEEEDSDPDDHEMEEEEEFHRRKQEREKALRPPGAREFFPSAFSSRSSSQVDSPWLPRANPSPVADEPWFTG